MGDVAGMFRVLIADLTAGAISNLGAGSDIPTVSRFSWCAPCSSPFGSSFCRREADNERNRQDAHAHPADEWRDVAIPRERCPAPRREHGAARWPHRGEAGQAGRSVHVVVDRFDAPHP